MGDLRAISSTYQPAYPVGLLIAARLIVLTALYFAVRSTFERARRPTAFSNEDRTLWRASVSLENYKGRTITEAT